MKTINTLMPTTFAVVLSLLLSGCGGGGSNEQASTTSPTTDQGNGSTDSSSKLTEAQALEKITSVLVDDVITTGATLSALCDQMVKCDVESITVGALATGIK